METTGDECERMVSLLAQGLPEREIASILGGNTEFKGLLAQAYRAYDVSNPSALVVAHADSLSDEERATWEEWALEKYINLSPNSPLQIRLLSALGTKETAVMGYEGLTKYLREDGIKRNIAQLTKGLSDIATLPGLTMICYLYEQMTVRAIEALPRPKLKEDEIETLRLLARGFSNKEIDVAQRPRAVRSTNTQVKKLLGLFKVNVRAQLTLIYLYRYQSAVERAAWRLETPFSWPTRVYPGRMKVLWLILTWKFCAASPEVLGKRLDISEETAKAHLRNLKDWLRGWPQNRGRNRAALIATAIVNK